MTHLQSLLLVLVVACGGKQTPTTTGNGSGSGSSEPPVAVDPRNEFQKRLTAACEAVGPRVTDCAVAAMKEEVAAGRLSQKDYELNTSEGVTKKHTEEFVKACDVPSMSSRQVRVLEVCFKEETECKPFVDCLSHLEAKPSDKPAPK